MYAVADGLRMVGLGFTGIPRKDAIIQTHKVTCKTDEKRFGRDQVMNGIEKS